MARALRLRVWELSEIINAFRLLDAEICFHHTPLPEAMNTIAGTSRKPVKDLFSLAGVELAKPNRDTVSQTWHKVLHKWSVKSHLTQAELEVLAGMGPILGSFGVSSQTLTIKEAVTRLQEIRSNAESCLDKQCQMRVYLGVAGGAILAICLL
jgi:stage III sporulation protein AB